MQFNSFEFLVFLPVVFLLHWLCGRGRRWQNGLLLAASYLFYGWWDWRFLLLIAFTSLCSYASGLLMAGRTKDGERRKKGKLVCTLNIVVNLLVLGLFKYYDFFVESLAALLATVGIRADWPTLQLILPVGISFYTFQALSYTIDVYRRQIEPTRDIVAFFTYISFFPQLVAGPIERATRLLPQFYAARRFSYPEAVDGMRLMLWGMVKKLVVADNCAVVVNDLMGRADELTGFQWLLCGLLFTFQIYGDFSGYSDIAIGCARLFGIRLTRNFDRPYFATSIGAFWRRWHISLMTWLRDYLYIPLGGSRRGRWRTVFNTFVVFFVSGLWHGANWTFVLWGLYHATLVSSERLCKYHVQSTTYNVKGTKYASPLHFIILKFLKISLTFLLVVVGWLLFRAESVEQIGIMLRALCSPSLLAIEMPTCKRTLLLCLLLLLAEWMQRVRQHPLQFPAAHTSHRASLPYALLSSTPVRWAVYYALILACLFMAGTPQTFLYFQF